LTQVRIPRLVAAGQARKHIRELLDAGMSRRKIAKAAGTSSMTIRMILGQGCGKCTRTNRIHPELAGAILAVSVPRPLPDPEERKPGAWTDADDQVGYFPEEFTGSLRTLAWQKHGNCAGPEVPTYIFFPSRGDGTTLNAARSVCADCPVKRQ
jgi:hypothetical protein